MQCWLFAAHNMKKRSRTAPFGKWLPWVFRFFLMGCRMSRIHLTGCRMSRPPRNLKKKRKSGQWAVTVLFGGLRSIYPLHTPSTHTPTSTPPVPVSRCPGVPVCAGMRRWPTVCHRAGAGQPPESPRPAGGLPGHRMPPPCDGSLHFFCSLFFTILEAVTFK
jgi:hypothetical protein